MLPRHADYFEGFHLRVPLRYCCRCYDAALRRRFSAIRFVLPLVFAMPHFRCFATAPLRVSLSIFFAADFRRFADVFIFALSFHYAAFHF